MTEGKFVEAGQPAIEELSRELRDTITDAGVFFEKLERSHDTRFCIWPGQSPDGRKHAKAIGGSAFPWEGATDTRIPLADEIVQEQVMVMLAAFFRTQVQAVGVDAQDQMRSAKISNLMKWMLYVKMLPHLWRELQLAAQWRQDPGMSLMSIEWEQETRVTLERMDLEMLAAQAQALPDSPEKVMMLDMADLFYDPLREREALEVLRAMSPLAKAGMARRMLRELRQTGQTNFPKVELVTNRPRWRALRPFVDVVFPTEMDDFQSTRWVCRLEYVDEATLRDRIVTAGYSEEFVEAALKQKGHRMQISEFSQRYPDQSFSGPQLATRTGLEDFKNYVELLHFYHRCADEYGQPMVYYTVFNDAVRAATRGDLWALHQPHGYEHGQYPFVPMTREHVSRRQVDSRGVSEIAGTWQHEVKVQRDARADYTQVATIPPLIVPPQRGGEFQFGPGVQWTGRRGMNPEFAAPPPFNPASIQMEQATMQTADRYFGRMAPTVPPALAQLHQQHLVTGFLIECRLCMGQTFALMQQFMDEEEVVRVVGRIEQPFKVSREEIQGQYDFHLDFDVRNLDMEFVKEKLKTIQEVVMPFDRFGIFDMATIAQWAMRSLDPNLADMAAASPQAASEREVEEEKTALAQMVSGVEPAMKLGNMNWQLRLQTLQQSVMANPELQQALAQNPEGSFAKMLGARVKFLQHQVQQQQNAVTGRIGARPALGAGV